MERTPNALHIALASLVLASHALAVDPSASEIPPYLAADPSATPVTGENLLQRERFWPYQVALRSEWQPAGSDKALEAGLTGVLIRVESATHARVDFGGDGLHSVPVVVTDLVERANRIRRGELTKTAPNFAFALGSRLVDSASEPMRPMRFAEATRSRAYLTVFANLEELEAMAPLLAPLAERRELLTIVLPQGRISDARVRDQLRRLEWKVPFLYDHLAEAYTPSLLPAGLAMPAVVLQTAEGRVLFQSSWGPDVAEKLVTALDQSLPPIR